MLKLLKQYNASFEIQNYRGDLPVHEAVQTGSKGKNSCLDTDIAFSSLLCRCC